MQQEQIYQVSISTQNREEKSSIVATVRDTLHWLPTAMRKALLTPNNGLGGGQGGIYRYSLSSAERVVMRRQKYLSPSQWAEQRRVVRMSSLPGRWQNLFTPYLVGIMDAARHTGVQVVILCKTPQTGGSEAGLNILGQMIEMSPGPAMVVFPDEITAKENSKDRILPMLQDSPRLRKYMSGSVDDASSIRINLRHMPIYLGWSGSVSRLGNKPIRILILDELDKYQNVKREATSESLAEKRTTTWKSRRFIFKLSTPTTEGGPIWRAFTEEAHARFDYYVICPFCGTAQRMDFEHIGWPQAEEGSEVDPERVLSNRLAWYTCMHCDAHWTDADRDLAVRKGYWVERASGLELFAHLHQYSPTKIGFHLPAWNSYFVSLSEVAWSYLKYEKSGRMEDVKEFYNQYRAEPWVEQFATREEDSILALCDDRPRGAVPSFVDGSSRVACLLAGVDTQGSSAEKGYFRYTIRAFGYGSKEESWLIQSGVAPSFEALDEILWDNVYRDADGHEYKIRACMIDAMGNRTKEVYTWALRHRGRVFPWQGLRSSAQPYTPSPQEYFPDARGNKVRIPGGLNLWRCDTTFFKSDLSHKLSIAPEDPGAFHLHSNDGKSLEQYSKEMCAEVWDDEKQGWENPKRKPNHFWDCEVMSLALAYIMNVRNMAEPATQGSNRQATRPVSQRPQAACGSRSIENRLANLRR